MLSFNCWNCGRTITADERSTRAVNCGYCALRNEVPKDAKALASRPKTPNEFFQSALDAASITEKVRLFKRALDICPTHQRSLTNLAILLQDKANDYAEAARYCLLVAAHATESINGESVSSIKDNMRDRAATCYFKLGRFAEAISIWDSLLQSNTFSVTAKAKIKHDRDVAQSKLTGGPVRKRFYGPPGQGMRAIEAALNVQETRSLTAALSHNASAEQIRGLVESFGFASDDAKNLADDFMMTAHVLMAGIALGVARHQTSTQTGESATSRSLESGTPGRLRFTLVRNVAKVFLCILLVGAIYVISAAPAQKFWPHESVSRFFAPVSILGETNSPVQELYLEWVKRWRDGDESSEQPTTASSPASSVEENDTAVVTNTPASDESTDTSEDRTKLEAMSSASPANTAGESAHAAIRRTWTNSNGKAIEAEFLRVEGHTVHIRRTSDGKTFEYPLENLSDVDQQWVKQHLEKTNPPTEPCPGTR